MQTYSHLIITAVLLKSLKQRSERSPDTIPSPRNSALLLGSVLPDLPLIVLSIFTITRDLSTGAFNNPVMDANQPGTNATEAMMQVSLTMRLFDDWFFNNPWVIAIHNLFHSPILLALYISVAYVLWRRGNPRAGWFVWLFCAAMLHTLIDIPLHVTDGPLVFFPFNWEWRYQAPISYWDPKYFGREWSLFEHSLIVGFLLYMVFDYRKRMWAWLRRTA